MQEEKLGFGKRFSKLFSSKPVVPEGETPQVEQTPPPEEAPPEEVPPVRPIPGPHFKLSLPDEGSTWTLWTIQNQELSEGPQYPPPVLVLDDLPPGKPLLLTNEQLENEIARLRISVEVRSGARLKQAREQVKRPEGAVNLPVDYFVHMTQNAMMAWLFLFPPMGGGGTANKNDAMAALRKAGITTGIDEELVDQYVQETQYFQLLAVAWGTPTQEGEDGRVVEHYPRECARTPVVDESGNVDYREQNYVQTIGKDDVICDIFPPRPGVDGIQVTGKVVKARVVQPARAPGGKNTTLNPEGTQLLSSVDGHLDFSGKVFQVKSILEVDGDVDYSTGNVNVFGDVHITGDVRENFSVRATGDVTIDGLVEAATIEADGNIIITKGVLGDNKAMIRSRKTVRAKYLENCVVYASDCVYADCIISSQVYSDNLVSVLTGRGTIIGGCTSAANLVEATVIGTKGGRRNELILGRMPNVEQERNTSAGTIKDIQDQLDGMDRQIRYLEQRQNTPENAKLLGKLRLDRSVQGLKLEKLTRRLAELEGLAPALEGCRVRCGMLYPVTTITIGNCTRCITDEWVNSTVRYDIETRDIVFV